MSSLIGQTLGQYEIVALLGKGGMATVYRAKQRSIDREVAIKVIKPDLVESGDFIERFKREARTIASLSHPHILKVFDYGQFGDLVYLVVELLKGGSLDDRINEGPMPLPEIEHMLSQVGLALDYAHNHGVIHRDLKPQNVLLDENGNAHLTDFGIAKLVDAQTMLTQTGTAIGTPAYMPPEQWRGDPIDARSDIYALGIMLFEMLTGQLPYKGDSPFDMMHFHMHQPLPSIRSLRPDVPASIEAVVNKAVAKDPDQRYSSAAQMLAAFKATQSNTATIDENDEVATVVGMVPDATSNPTTAQPTTQARPSQQKGVNWLLPALGAGVVIVLGGIFIATRNNSTPTPTQLAAVENTPSVTLASTSTTVPTQQVVQPTTVAPTNTALPTSTLTPTTLPTTVVPPTATSSPTPSATPRQSAITLVNGILPLYRGHTGGVTSVAFSSDSKYVLTGSRDYTAILWESGSGNLVRTFKGHKGALLSVAFSPDGKQIATGSEDETVRIWDTATGDLLQTLGADGGQVFSVAFSPDGKYVLSSSQDGYARLWDAESGQVIHQFGPHNGWAIGVAFSPDGKTIVTGSADYKLRLWDITSGSLIKTLTGHTGPIRSVAFSSDGKYIVSASADKTARRWNATTGDELNQYQGHSDWVFSAAFSPDGKYILTGSKDHTAVLWNAETAASLALYSDHTDWVTSVAFSPDGIYALTGSSDMTARLWLVEVAQ